MEERTVKNLNVGLLGLAFMLVFTAFQTMGNVQTVILDSAKDPNSGGYVDGFTGSGLTSLAVIYSVFSLANWFAPPIVAFIGPKLTLFGGGVAYAAFIAQITYPNNYLLYGASALIGLGAAMIWIAQGNFLTLNSDSTTMEKNSGIFWAMMQCSLLIGNTFVYFQFQGISQIDKETRLTVALVLLAICIVGVLVFLFLRPTPWASATDSAATMSPSEVFKGAFRLLVTPNMLLLTVTFAYTGMLLTFWSGVYGTCIGFTKAFTNAKSLVGLHGIVVGVGEILGGLVFGIFGQKIGSRFGRNPPVILGALCHIGALVIAYLNLPPDSPFQDTDTKAIIESNEYLAIVGSFFLGLGDACYNTQIYALIGSVYSDNSAPAFAIFKFFQSALAAGAFYYSTELELPWQLLFLAIFCVLGTSTFFVVEWRARRVQGLSAIEGGGGNDDDNSCGIIATNDEEEVKA